LKLAHCVVVILAIGGLTPLVTAQNTPAPQYIDDGKMPKITLEDCCATPAQEVLYCKAWAAAGTHIDNKIPHSACCGGGQWSLCSALITHKYAEERMYGQSHTTYQITDQEKQTAEKALRDDEDEVRTRNLLESQKCTSKDLRSAEEQASDPNCVIQKQNWDMQKKSEEQMANHEQARQIEAVRLGIHEGQSQASVKAILLKKWL
jgi:hypothetical protein